VSEQPQVKPWSVEYEPEAAKVLRKLDKRDSATAQGIRKAMLAVAATGAPRSRGKALTHDRAGQWRYRVGDWRVIADIQDRNLVNRRPRSPAPFDDLPQPRQTLDAIEATSVDGWPGYARRRQVGKKIPT